MKTKIKNLCIYHKSCADGFGAALAVKYYFDGYSQECEFVACHYGDEAPDVVGMNVVIVDFSFPRDVLIAMNETAEKIIVLDHHKTAKSALEGLDFCQFDMERSGAMMAWEHFNGTEETPELIKFIQDRDLWQWQMINSKELSSGLQLLPLDFDIWYKYLDNENLYDLIRKGKTVLEYQEQQVKRALSPEKIRMVTVQGHSVPMVNSTTLISEICGALAKDHPFAISYFDTPKDRVYSLRSRGDGEDVSVIAKSFGGGGHAASAGFSIPHTDSQL